MCTVKTITVGDKTVRVADIKTKYIQNIVDAAADCDLIDKIILFGSSLNRTCFR